MANEGNLKPFQKGHDPRRNVKGRIPPAETKMFKHLLLKHLNTKVKVGDKMMTKMELMAHRIIDDAVRGKISAIKILMDRTEGKVRTQKQMGIGYSSDSREWSPSEEAEWKRLTRLFATEEELKKMDAQDSTKS